MSLKALRDVLQSGKLPISSSCVMNALAQITIDDLGFCASEWAATQWFTNRSFPLGRHGFSIRHALQTTGADRWMGQPNCSLGCCTLYKSNEAIISWFAIPPSRALPLHDHNGMCVWQRVLFGELRVVSFDWIDSCNSCKTRDEILRLGRFRAHNGGDGVVVFNDVCGVTPNQGTPVQSSVVSFGPGNGGVLHEIINESDKPALFIDVIAPPYETPPDGIQCTYFHTNMETDISVASVGQKVHISPRLNYHGPHMDAFVPITQLF